MPSVGKSRLVLDVGPRTAALLKHLASSKGVTLRHFLLGRRIIDLDREWSQQPQKGKAA